MCGSGLLSAVTELVDCGAVNKTGRLQLHPLVTADGPRRSCVLDEENGVLLTQQDIRQVQLAKSAVRAGMEALLHHARLNVDEVEKLDVAGGFGSFLRLKSAAAIGLIPPVLAPRCRVLGNAALAGAAMLLHDGSLLSSSAAMADAAETVELSTDPYFMEQYVANMMF